MRRTIALLAVSLAACAEPAAVVDAGPVTTAPPEATTTSTSAPAEPGPEQTTTTTTTMGSSGSSEETTGLSAYFMLDEVVEQAHRPGPFLVPVYREVPSTPAVARAAMEELLAGPSTAEASGIPAISSAIPEGVVLLDVTIEDGLATVDLSREFESGGGTLSMTARLAQVTYTLTQFPTVDRVTFRLDGEPVTVFSGEGIALDQPVGRDDFLDLLPLIFVDRPAWGGPLAQPARVFGTGAVFEATFQFALTDADGVILEEGIAMTTEGQGWGDFDFTIPYSVDTDQPGSLIVWSSSAEDGSQQNLREHPVTLSGS